MAKMTAAEIKALERDHAAIQSLGTPEMGYTDAGLWRFLKFVFTKDSHDSENPVKRLMQDGAEYLLVVFLYMLACPVLAVPKSRQIRMSWAAVAFSLWHAMSRPHRRVIFQTKKEEDAHDMITFGHKNPAAGRCDFVLQHLPGWMRDPNVVGGSGNRAGALIMSPLPVDSGSGARVPWYGSSIEAVPQGADQVRGKTPSLYISDEAAFQDAFADAVVALRPAVTGGGRFIAISSVDAGSHFNQMVLEGSGASGHTHTVHPTVQRALDLLGMEWPKGMKSWQTPSGVWVLEVHYSADPAKDPERDGAKWFEDAVKVYIGGVESTGWKTEMEIDYNAGGGVPVFPFAQPGSPIYVPAVVPSEVLGTHRFVAGYDYGTRNPAALEVAAVNSKGHPKFVWEVYEPCERMPDHSRRIKACPYWKEIEAIYCDPSLVAQNQHTASGLRSMVEIFADYGIVLTPGRRGQDVPVAMRIMSDWWFDPENPLMTISKNCPNLWREARDLRWEKHISSGVAMRKNNLEKIRQKDNHAFDAAVLAIDSGMSPFIAPTAPGPGYGTFGYAADRMRAEARAARNKGGGIRVV